MLLDITAVDYPSRSKRFEVVYNLLSLNNFYRLRVKIFLNDSTSVPSLTKIYHSAGWYEREVWDMYGISFNGTLGKKSDTEETNNKIVAGFFGRFHPIKGFSVLLEAAQNVIKNYHD